MAVVESVPVMEKHFRLPTELDEYMQESIYHMVGFCSTEEEMKKRETEAKEEQRKLQAQLARMQQKMRELEFKSGKAKEEAALNAQALRRQVAECSKLTEQCSRLKEECSRLENECQLFHNDREVFMEAADEAEERAAEAYERATDAEARASALFAETERLKRQLALTGARVEGGESVSTLRARVSQLEADNGRLQKELSAARSEAQLELSSAHDQIAKLGKDKAELMALVSTANERYRELLRELTAAQDGSSVLREVELPVNLIGAAAAGAGVCKAMEQENRAAASDCKSLVKSMKKELYKSKAKLSVAEEKVQALLEEVEELKAAVALSNEDSSRTAEEMQYMSAENKVMRLILSARADSLSISPNTGVSNCLKGVSRPPSQVQGWHKCMQRM